jgi:KUP system potassium uptake protein
METVPAYHSNHLNKVSWAGLLISIGIVFGDIGTSPLYTYTAIIRGNKIDEIIALGSLSCIFWTLTFQTTLKYIIITLKADNKGEGGIFSLFALVRKYRPWLVVPAIMGGSFLLADGIITPPISVSSAVEGLKEFNSFHNLNVIPIVIGILVILFSLQSFGTQVIGKMFGPAMLIWFSFIGIIGALGLSAAPWVLKGLNPFYAWQLLDRYPGGFWLLGGVFLCTTGAEALYSDMGHCGRNNIRVSWIFIKITLLLSYAGQAAWLVNHQGSVLGAFNPFYAIVPQQILGASIVLATVATIIASQALISGSFTLISEAMRLYLWPRMKIVYPTDFRGQMFVPAINWVMMACCIGVVLHFRESKNMEAAFGLAVTLTMLMSTILINTWLYIKRVNLLLIGAITIVFLTIETGFLVANLKKFPQGGWISILLGFLLMYIMFIWHKAKSIKYRLTEFEPIAEHLPMLRQLSNDQTVAKYATNLIYLTASGNNNLIESKAVYSIFNRFPKRADIYWFIHVNVLDEPYAARYTIQILEKEDIVWINFNLGFRIEPRLNYFFRIVVDELVKNKEIDITSRYASLSHNKVNGDFNFVVMRNFLSYENDLTWWDDFIMRNYFIMRKLGLSEQASYGLDTSNVTVENVPLILNLPKNFHLTREELSI